MCIHCRRPYDEALHTECAGSDPTLHGGPVGTRKRRTPEPHTEGAVAKPTITGNSNAARTRRSRAAGHTGTLSAEAA